MLKETKSIADLNIFDIIILLGVWEEGLAKREKLDDTREIQLITLKTAILPQGKFWRIIKSIEWFLRIIVVFSKENIVMVNCHSLPVLSVGMIFKTFKHSKVIYDTHELETETATMSRIRKLFSKILERLLINHVDSVIVVSNSIADWYKNQYKLKTVNVVRNVPYYCDTKYVQPRILKERFNIPQNHVLYIYQGMLSTERGIEILLSVFSKLNNNRHIVFMGYGPLENSIKKYEAEYPNIHLQPAVKPEEITHFTSSADIGICIIKSTCLSYYYSLPNKLFEYIMSGLPVIVNDFPEMAKFVDDNKIGWKVPADEESISQLIKETSIVEIEEKRDNVLNCKNKFSWEIESKNLSKVYKELFK